MKFLTKWKIVMCAITSIVVSFPDRANNRDKCDYILFVQLYFVSSIEYREVGWLVYKTIGIQDVESRY